jgi:hypothetical protein
MWNLRLAESVGDGATDAVVVAQSAFFEWVFGRLKINSLLLKKLDLTENGNTPGTIGPAGEILNKYGDRGSGCSGLIIGKHGNLSTTPTGAN